MIPRTFLLTLVCLFTLGAHATPPAKTIKKMKTALIVIDVQNDYFPGGLMELTGAEQAADNIRQIQDHFRKNKLPVIHIQHISGPGASFFRPNTTGVEIHAKVKPQAGEKLIVKGYPNSFRETELLKHLQENGITHLTIVGMMTHMCVDATVRAAKDYGFECTVVSDACATRALEADGKTVRAEDVQTSFMSSFAFFYATVQTTKAALAN